MIYFSRNLFCAHNSRQPAILCTAIDYQNGCNYQNYVFKKVMFINFIFYHRYRLEIPKPAPSYTDMRFQFGVFIVFPMIKIIVIINQVCMYCTAVWAWSYKHLWNTARFAKIVCAFVSACVVSKNLNTPNLSSMADDTITQGRVQSRSSGISFPYLCFLRKVRLCVWSRGKLLNIKWWFITKNMWTSQH